MNEIRLVYKESQASMKKAQRKGSNGHVARDEPELSQVEIEKQFERDFCR